MSIIVSDLTYHYLDQPNLFESISFSIPTGGKVSLVGNNGVGKSTLLKLLARQLEPSSGNIRTVSPPYYVPQQIDISEQTVADALGVADKIDALHAIYAGSVDQLHYDILDDEWEVEDNCRTALDHWHLQDIPLELPMERLSGGEKTKVLLAGLTLHQPDIVLLDEPTNHLDLMARKRVYEYISGTRATVVVVSHDITLLNLLDFTYELTRKGIALYGGNYDFYQAQKEVEIHALEQQIDAEQRALRIARRRAEEIRERQEKRRSHGERSKQKGGVARIVLNARRNLSEKSSARLSEKHSGIIENRHQRLARLKEKQLRTGGLKVDFGNTILHDGKVLIRAEELNFGYKKERLIWTSPVDIEIRSGERIHLLGDNGSGKTTLLRLLLGELPPTLGRVIRSDFSHIYLDQEYALANRPLTVLELAEEYNLNHLADHEVRLRLNRALFPEESWNKSCLALSGGERMRLCLCCLMISNQIPDLFILDEPTNNLDLRSLSILTRTIRDYRGTLLVISHDTHFIHEIGISRSFSLPSPSGEEEPGSPGSGPAPPAGRHNGRWCRRGHIRS
ncbi:ABC-F family ATP-binding cassette domain-containing protein [Petrimonas mucosa]|jgi:ATPase subunit of ABC transporter with duplicated ATPase domains|uniref:Tylosin resistance ATP-binding protein TlrC n=3 Tax=Petrimonas mucosa TaxID=1642646 RepID=A0A1G4G4R7_9BACT|nr:ATP-binding cassette domain-containing protein [Petrimonas mucosa]SCM55993.1 Tylosin resistance ATP-binding protein TlrC [Petrimonas mucosa]